MAASQDGTRRAMRPSVAAAMLLLAGSVAAYASLLTTQRELFTNGLPTDSDAYPRPGADLVAAAASLDRFWFLTGVVLALYLGLLLTVRLARSPAAGRIAVAVAALGHVALVGVPPGLSIDVYSYVAHGYLASLPFTSPYLTAAGAAAGTPIGPTLMADGWMPVHPQTPYGPLWTWTESLAVQVAGGDVGLSVILLKSVVIAATLGAGLAAYGIAQRFRPGLGIVAAVAWLLNPLVVVEFAAEGHNDAVAILFVLLALLFALRGWAVPAVVALGLATLTKYTPAAFALPVLVMLVRTVRSRTRLLVELAIGVLVSAALAWLLWQRWWAGAATFDGLRSSTTPYPTLSPAGWLASLWTAPDPSSPSLLPQLALTGAMLAVVLAASWGRTADGFLVGCAVIAFAILAASPLYWPWYSALAIAVLAVRPTWASLLQVLVLTVGSRVAAPWGDLSALGVLPFDDAARNNSVFGLDAPLAVCAAVALVAAVVWAVRAAVQRRRAPVAFPARV